MHPAFECFEWGVFEDQHPHPNGELAFPAGPWNHAVLSLKRTGEDIGEAWYRQIGDLLTVEVRVQAARGGSDDPWLIRLVADTLFGPGGFCAGHHEQTVSRVRYGNLETSGWWEGTWPEMRGRTG
jgi:hypothetical protein